MSKITNKSQIEKQFLAEMGSDLNSASIENLKLSETVSKAVSENIPDAKKSDKKKNDKKSSGSIFAGISDQIYGILKTKSAKSVILPSITIQKKRVRRSIEKEQSKLISQAHKIKNSRRFKASALEEVVSQIRYLQSLIDDMFNLANKKITELYKKYYLKIG